MLLSNRKIINNQLMIQQWSVSEMASEKTAACQLRTILHLTEHSDPMRSQGWSEVKLGHSGGSLDSSLGANPEQTANHFA